MDVSVVKVEDCVCNKILLRKWIRIFSTEDKEDFIKILIFNEIESGYNM